MCKTAPNLLSNNTLCFDINLVLNTLLEHYYVVPFSTKALDDVVI